MNRGYGLLPQVAGSVDALLGEAMGTATCHPTWARVFCLMHLAATFPGKHLISLDSDCAVTALYETEDLWQLRLIKTKIVTLKTNRYTETPIDLHKEPNMAALAEREVSASQDRSALAKMVMALLDHWKLSTEDQAALLGIAASNRAALSNYRSGKPVGTSRDQYERVGHLLGIHKNLRLLFPQNRELVYGWMSTRNKAFDNLTPVEVVKEWGFAGLLMVRGYLDRALGV
jgi:hypothetical protein